MENKNEVMVKPEDSREDGEVHSITGNNLRSNLSHNEETFSLSSRSVFIKVLLDSIKNIIFFGFLAFVIAFIMNGLGWRLIGFILSLIYTIFIAFSLVKFIFVDFLLQIAGIFAALKALLTGDVGLLRKQIYLFFGTLVLLIESIISVVYVLYLYNAYYQVYSF